MKSMSKLFSKGELLLWAGSVLAITGSFLIFDRQNVPILLASYLGVTSLIFSAKGHPVGQLLMVLFSVIYGIIAFLGRYYGETITYLGMTGPMALFALIAWLRHPFAGQKSQVAVNHLQGREWFLMAVLSVFVTAALGWLLAYFETAQLFLSTVSITTSFVAVYLTFRRSAYFPLAYAANDAVLVTLWTTAARQEPSYFSISVCFLIFLVNDLYGFISWIKMEQLQALEPAL